MIVEDFQGSKRVPQSGWYLKRSSSRSSFPPAKPNAEHVLLNNMVNLTNYQRTLPGVRDFEIFPQPDFRLPEWLALESHWCNHMIAVSDAAVRSLVEQNPGWGSRSATSAAPPATQVVTASIWHQTGCVMLILVATRKGDNLCQEWLQGLPLLQVCCKYYFFIRPRCLGSDLCVLNSVCK